MHQANGVAPIGYTRTKNYIGKSQNSLDGQTIFVFLDDLKFFNRSLTQSEIIKVLNSYY